MPRYRYKSSACHKEWWEWMGLKDPQPEHCPYCVNGLPFKIITKFVTIEKGAQNDKSAKENVIEHIEENREILKQMKNEARGKTE